MRAGKASPRHHQKITPKWPEFRPRTRAYASSRLRRPIHRRGDSTKAHDGVRSMINVPATAEDGSHSNRQETRHECTHYRLLESRAAHAVGNDQLLPLRLLRSSCPPTAAPPGCRRGSIPVEDLEQVEPSIDGCLRWLSSQPLGALAASRTRAVGRDDRNGVAAARRGQGGDQNRR
jgi:hypothetical protein